METTKHTPGPWAISQNNPRLVKHLSGPVLAECGPVNTEEAQANARLIAAAPELFDALNKLLSRAEYHLDRSATHDGLMNVDAIVDARAVLAKAKGE